MRGTPITELFSLKGKVALITGGCAGLGAQAAEALAEAGAAVVITSRTAEKAQKAAADLAERTGAITAGIALDVTSEDNWAQAVKSVCEAFGGLNILVNNAGGRRVTETGFTANMDAAALFLEGRSVADWQYTLDTNLTGVFLGCRAVAPIMKAAGRGKIINLASIDGIRGRDLRIYEGTGLSPTVPDYLASKAAVINLTKGIAVALAPYGICVNSIAPGGFQRGQGEAFVRNYSDCVPLGRMGNDMTDLKGAFLFCASAASDYMVGHNLVIDGGFTAW